MKKSKEQINNNSKIETSSSNIEWNINNNSMHRESD
jgi:hypothetical protein